MLGNRAKKILNPASPSLKQLLSKYNSIYLQQQHAVNTAPVLQRRVFFILKLTLKVELDFRVLLLRHL